MNSFSTCPFYIWKRSVCEKSSRSHNSQLAPIGTTTNHLDRGNMAFLSFCTRQKYLC